MDFPKDRFSALYCSPFTSMTCRISSQIAKMNLTWTILSCFFPLNLDTDLALASVSQDLHRVVEWLSQQQLLLNPDKTKFQVRNDSRSCERNLCNCVRSLKEIQEFIFKRNISFWTQSRSWENLLIRRYRFWAWPWLLTGSVKIWASILIPAWLSILIFIWHFSVLARFFLLCVNLIEYGIPLINSKFTCFQ